MTMLGVVGRNRALWSSLLRGGNGGDKAAAAAAWTASKRCMSSTSEMTVREDLNSTLDEEMSADSKVFVLGEEVGEHQGAYKITVPEALNSNCLDDLNNRLNALEGQLKAKFDQVHALDRALKMSFDGLKALGKTLNDQTVVDPASQTALDEYKEETMEEIGVHHQFGKDCRQMAMLQTNPRYLDEVVWVGDLRNPPWAKQQLNSASQDTRNSDDQSPLDGRIKNERCGRLQDTRGVFDKLVKKNTHGHGVPHDYLFPLHCSLLPVSPTSWKAIMWFLLPASLIVINDTMAYIFGVFFGRTPLIKLSIENVGGFHWSFCHNRLIRFSGLTCPRKDLSTSWLHCDPGPLSKSKYYPLPSWLPDWFPWKEFGVVHVQTQTMAFGLFASIVAAFGGFFASGYKRAFKIKDFGDSIPGHGGITDRMDCQMGTALFSHIYYQSFIAPHRYSAASFLDQILVNLTLDEQINFCRQLAEVLNASQHTPQIY